jgi:hypothetical protein
MESLKPNWAIEQHPVLKLTFFFFLVVLGFELGAYPLIHSTSTFL